MCHEQLSLSHLPSLQSLISVVMGELRRRSKTYPRQLRLQQVGARSGDEKLLTSHFLTDAKPLLSMRYKWADSELLLDSCSSRGGSAFKIDNASVQLRFARVVSCPCTARYHNNTHAYFVSQWEKEAEREDYFRTTLTEKSEPKFKFRLLRSHVKLLTFQNFKPKRVNKSEMLQKFSQTRGTIFHSSACNSSCESFFKNRSAQICGKSPPSGDCPPQIAIPLSWGLKILMKWNPTLIYGDLNFSDFQQVFANLFSWRKLEGSLIIPENIKNVLLRKFELQQFSPRGADWSGMLARTIQACAARARARAHT